MTMHALGIMLCKHAEYVKGDGKLPGATSEGAGAGVCGISMPKSWCISCLLMTCFSPLFAVQ